MSRHCCWRVADCVVAGGLLTAMVMAVTGVLRRGRCGSALFQRDSGDLTRRAQTRGRRGGCRLAKTARPMVPARSGVPVMTLRAPVTSVW
ncbi:MAG: hypothetical protein ACRD4I_13490, partial [Candidatus Angelobacter sp.]